MPHFESLPLSELAKEVERLDSVEAVSLFKPVMEYEKLFRIVFVIMAQSFFADGVVLFKTLFLLLLECAIIDHL